MQKKLGIVMKFGGSIMSDGKDFYNAGKYAVNLISSYRPIAVVSAPKGVTNLLTNLHRKHDGGIIKGLKRRYAAIVASIPDSHLRRDASNEIEYALEALNGRMSYDRFVSQGEDHSGIILSHFIKSFGCESRYIDGYRTGMTVDSKGIIKEKVSISNVKENLREYLDPDNGVIPVIGGFVGRDLDTGKHRLLGRNSTDVTGAIVAAATHSSYEIIKDVPGIYFVEPEFRKSNVIPFLSYDEAEELAWRGIEAVHPIAVRICDNHNIPIHVKTLHGKISTLISRRSISTPKRPVIGISARRFYLLTINDELMNTPEGRGYLSNLTRALSNNGIEIYDVATSANVISITIHPRDSIVNGKKIEITLTKCLEEHGYRPNVMGERIGAISMVGDALRNNTEIVSRLTELFRKSRINILMISKGKSQNLIFGINEKYLRTAVNLLSREFL
jgi:aspartate kinase